MDTKKEKNLKDISDAVSAASSGVQNLKTDISKDMLIHVMPKRFIKSASSAKSTKGVGILILAGGGIFLIVALGFFYYYLTGPEENEPINTEKSSFAPEGAMEDKEASGDKTEGEEETKKEPSLVETEKTIIEDEKKPSAEASGDKTEGEEVEIATSTPLPKVILSPATTTSEEIANAIDTDNDGLYDVEEILLDCDLNSSDSDGDTYNDLSELLNLYNPAGGGSLMVNPNIEKYISSQDGFSLYYPYLWEVSENAQVDSVMFKMDNNQFIQILKEDNPERQMLNEWYSQQIGVEEIKPEQQFYKKGWQALKSEDGLTFYLAKINDDLVYIITYNLGVTNTNNFGNIMDMMVKSFEVD